MSLEATPESSQNQHCRKTCPTQFRRLFTALQPRRPPPQSINFRAFRPPKIDEEQSLEDVHYNNDETCIMTRPCAKRCTKSAPKMNYFSVGTIVEQKNELKSHPAPMCDHCCLGTSKDFKMGQKGTLKSSKTDDS